MNMWWIACSHLLSILFFFSAQHHRVIHQHHPHTRLLVRVTPPHHPVTAQQVPATVLPVPATRRAAHSTRLRVQTTRHPVQHTVRHHQDTVPLVRSTVLHRLTTLLQVHNTGMWWYPLWLITKCLHYYYQFKCLLMSALVNCVTTWTKSFFVI